MVKKGGKRFDAKRKAMITLYHSGMPTKKLCKIFGMGERKFLDTLLGDNDMYKQAYPEYYKHMAYKVYMMEHKCARCGFEGVVAIHHKDSNKTNNSKENLIILCYTCHAKAHNLGRTR